MRKPLIHTHCHLIYCVYIKGHLSIHIVWCWRCWDRLIHEIKAMSKVSKIDQIHIRVVMLCMSKTLKILKQAIHIVWCWRHWDRLIQEIKAMSKVSKIDQIHIRVVMLCMSKMSKVMACFNIFDIFNIHSITALRCIWSIFDIFDIL